jgi:hypothetical protein
MLISRPALLGRHAGDERQAPVIPPVGFSPLAVGMVGAHFLSSRGVLLRAMSKDFF